MPHFMAIYSEKEDFMPHGTLGLIFTFQAMIVCE